MVFFRDAIQMAFTEDGVLLSAIGAGVGAHVFDEPQYRDMHHFGHFNRFFYYHADKLLRSSDNDDAIDGEGLEHRKGNITGAGGHIHKHEIDVFPVHIGPELAHRAGNNRAAPNNRVAFLREQQIDGHDLGAKLGKQQAA